jgi:very-short-patch-repair endonuclease
VQLHWSDLAACERVGDRPVTTPLRTVVDCSRTLAFGPGLAIAAVDARSESGLESALRAIAVRRGLRGFVPQVVIRDGTFQARVDLADVRRRIVAEADSFEHHGHRQALVRDCERYDELVLRGWLVLRFAWEHVMFRPDWVGESLVAAVRGSRRMPPNMRKVG